MAINTPVYSIIYDKSLASDPEACLTYAGSCEGFTPMCNTGDMNCDEGSWAEGNGTIFDAIKVGYYYDSFTEQSKSVVTSSTINNFTKIPKIYQRVTDISDAKDNSKVRLDLSLEPFEGASLHPSFIRDGSEINNLYIGRYLGSYDGLSLRSTSSANPKTGLTRATFRQYASDGGCTLLKYYDWDLVNKLYLLAFKNFDSQTALGPGLTNGSITTTGGTDGGSWMCSKSMTGSASMCFLGIEDWWGHCCQYIDDFYGNGGVYYAGNNTTPTDDTANKTVIASSDFTSSSARHPLTCQGTADGFFIGETSGGSNTTGLCDFQYNDLGENLGFVGGKYNDGSLAGAFNLDANDILTVSYAYVGARLTYVD